MYIYIMQGWAANLNNTKNPLAHKTHLESVDDIHVLNDYLKTDIVEHIREDIKDWQGVEIYKLNKDNTLTFIQSNYDTSD